MAHIRIQNLAFRRSARADMAQLIALASIGAAILIAFAFTLDSLAP